MHRWHVEIDTAALGRMYLDERLTTTQIARRLGCGASTVARRLRRHGMRVRPRGPDPERYGSGRPVHRPQWSPEVAWIVGLIATDGTLASTGRGVAITSKDIELLQLARRCLGLSNRLARVAASGWGTGGHRLQWRNRGFYEWLMAIGLTPRKSLTIGPLARKMHER
jgi:transposase-like protein